MKRCRTKRKPPVAAANLLQSHRPIGPVQFFPATSSASTHSSHNTALATAQQTPITHHLPREQRRGFPSERSPATAAAAAAAAADAAVGVECRHVITRRIPLPESDDVAGRVRAIVGEERPRGRRKLPGSAGGGSRGIVWPGGPFSASAAAAAVAAAARSVDGRGATEEEGHSYLARTSTV